MKSEAMASRMLVLGVDPGRSGKVVALDAHSPRARIWPLEFDESGLLCWEKIHGRIAVRPHLVLVEQVNTFVGQGWAAKAALQLGMVFGEVVGASRAMQWPVGLARPQSWQAWAHAKPPKTPKGKAKAPKPSAKERSLEAYGRLFPHDPLPKNRAGKYNDNDVDALLIAAYAVGGLLGLPLQAWRFPDGAK